jgi:hypothetical protein
MIKYITTALLLLCAIGTLAAQSNKKDTVVLSVYNNNQRFMLYPMPFGKNKPDKNFVAEMVVALDTLNVLETSTQRDTSGKFPKRWRVNRQCGKSPKNVKDKVALLYINTMCDISTQVYNAQEAGALAVIVIHTTNSTDSVTLPKLTGQQRYVDGNKVKIPCFTIRKVIGDKLTGMMPSLVGIGRPDSTVVVQTLTQRPTDSLGRTQAAATNADKTAATSNEETDDLTGTDKAANALTFKGIGWQIAPNPVSNEVTLNYNFKDVNTVKVDIFNEIGQLVTNYQLPDTQTGKLEISVTTWLAGEYNVRLTHGKLMEVKRMIVVH